MDRLIVPELGTDNQPIRLSLWLVRRGERVSAGEAVVELRADCATVDLPAPVDGVLLCKLAAEDDEVRVGQLLGEFDADAP